MNGKRTWQQCEVCGDTLDELSPAAKCPACGGLLEVHHHVEQSASELRAAFDRSTSQSGVWRFQSVILPNANAEIVSHPEGNTPLLERRALNAWCDIDSLLLKHEGQNPTGSFKDRGMTVGMTQARRVGARGVMCASTGNTSASLASYAAHAELPAIAIVPDHQVSMGKLAQTLAYGARTFLVDGDFDDCLRLMQQASDQLGIYQLNSINPFRLEGQKSVVFEMLYQLAWSAPDWIVLPAGNLGNTAAVGKAIREAVSLGLIARAPRIAAIQAEGAAPFARAFERGFASITPVHAETIATAIKIGDPASYGRAVRAIRETEGVVTSVTDAEILAAKMEIDRAGVGCEPASAATVAGVRKLRANGTIPRNAMVVGILTGHILKDPGLLLEIHTGSSQLGERPNVPTRIGRDFESLRSALSGRPGALDGTG